MILRLQDVQIESIYVIYHRAKLSEVAIYIFRTMFAFFDIRLRKGIFGDEPQSPAKKYQNGVIIRSTSYDKSIFRL